MGLMKSAFNAVTRLHSQGGWIKRPGSPDLFTPMRMTPSNYFRYIAGPSQTVVTGSECIIPIATIYGQQRVDVTVDALPTAGTWTISFDLNGTTVTTGSLAFDAIGADIQASLRLISGCENVTVIGDLQSTSTQISFIGVKSASNITVNLGSLVGTATAAYEYKSIAWTTPLIRRGDRILNASGSFTAKEVIEMPDLGGEIIGYRIRYE
jgi:hypothetical protein